jgi:CHAD domain-containing protein
MAQQQRLAGRIEAVGEELGENLRRCATEPSVDAVHAVRTGSRRLEAALEGLEIQIDGGSEDYAAAAAGLRRLLKKVRRAAGAVRDLDVHQKLLRKMVPGIEAGMVQEHEGDLQREIESLGLKQQARELDAWLERHREKNAAVLQRRAQKWHTRLTQRMDAVKEALDPVRKPVRAAGREGAARRQPSPGELALRRFAQLTAATPVLDERTLHGFRKGTKHARYLTEAAEESDQWSGQVGAMLKQIQDEIGDWHDWLLLAEEAQRAVQGDDEASELQSELETRRDQYYGCARKTAEHLRGRLMGEWQALWRGQTRPRSTQRSAAAARGKLA